MDQKTKVTQEMSSVLNTTARIKTIYSTKSQEQKNKIFKESKMSSSFYLFLLSFHDKQKSYWNLNSYNPPPHFFKKIFFISLQISYTTLFNDYLLSFNYKRFYFLLNSTINF